MSFYFQAMAAIIPPSPHAFPIRPEYLSFMSRMCSHSLCTCFGLWGMPEYILLMFSATNLTTCLVISVPWKCPKQRPLKTLMEKSCNYKKEKGDPTSPTALKLCSSISATANVRATQNQSSPAEPFLTLVHRHLRINKWLFLCWLTKFCCTLLTIGNSSIGKYILNEIEIMCYGIRCKVRQDQEA